MQTHCFQIWIIIQFFLNVDVQLQYINYISNYLASPRCIVLVFLPKRTFCFLSSSACSLLQHLGVYLDERNYNCISNKQHQNKIHSPQRKRNEIIYINFNSTARFWNDLKEASWAKYPLFCEMMWSCKCFINWKNIHIVGDQCGCISFIGEWSLITQEITSNLPQVTVKLVQLRLNIEYIS